MSSAWAVTKGVLLLVLAFTFGWIPYASDTPNGRRSTKLFFAVTFSALAFVFVIQREWELMGGMLGLAVLVVGGFVLADRSIARTDRAEQRHDDRRRAAMRRRIAKEQAAARRRPGRLP